MKKYLLSQLGRKLILWVMVSSGVLTALITATHLYLDFRNEQNQVSQVVEQIQKGYTKQLASSLWNLDLALLEIQLNGLLHFPYLKQAEVVMDRGKTVSVGRASDQELKYSFELEQKSEGETFHLGILHVSFDQGAIFNRILEKVAFVFFTQALKTFSISIFLMFLFHHLISKHLIMISRFLSSLNFFNINGSETLSLQRRSRHPDEIDDIVNSINNLTLQLADIRKVQDDLENAKAQAVNNSKLIALGEMAGGIAHEINTPLQVILGQAELVEMSTEGNLEMDPVQLRESVGSIKSMVHRTTKIIEGLKNFSRDSSNDSYVKCKLSDVISDTLVLCFEKLKVNNVDFKLFYLGEEISVENVEVISDTLIINRIQISQILLNIISNAYHAIENTERPCLKTHIERDEKWVKIKISDSGPGVPAHLREKIMMPFFTTKQIGSGTGLGLSISLGIAKAHGGNLVLQEGLPTTFVLSLPLTSSSPKKRA